MKRALKSAARLVVLDNSDPILAETEAIQERIRQRAFVLSQTRPPDAHEIYDWIVAESEIISVPPAELTEKDSGFEVKFAVAGVNPDDVHVMVTPDQVLLKSEYNHEHDANTGTVHMCDFRSATVFRSVNLPQSIDVKSVKVDVADGLVTVTASKQGAEPAQKRPRKTATKKTARARMP